ncbi:MAG: hypothetical protein QOD77_91 [Thermoplasmata archaeon]|jgi:hypothetical protein|nr:hypothetical protein [Thermoplasmata archaeon]
MDRSFVTVRFMGAGMAFAEHTRRHPGSCVDGIVESYADGPDGLRIASLVHVRGMPPAGFEALRADLAARYGDAKVVTADPQHCSWLVRCTIHGNDLPPLARFLAKFQQSFCVPWTHVEGGRVLMRAEARGEDGGQEEAGRIRAFFEDQGIEGSVECGQVGGEEMGSWLLLRALVEASGRGDQDAQPAWQRLGRVRELP